MEFNPPPDEKFLVVQVNGHYEFVDPPEGMERIVDRSRFWILPLEDGTRRLVAVPITKELIQEADLWSG